MSALKEKRSYNLGNTSALRARKLRDDLSAEDLAWVAGLLEGEGCFTIDSRPDPDGTLRAYPRVTCAMTDRDIVERLRATLNCGSVYPKAAQHMHHKDQYIWKLSTISDIFPLLTLLKPLMGERRRARIDELLTLEKV